LLILNNNESALVRASKQPLKKSNQPAAVGCARDKV
jgi:hypothetical protein